MRIVEKTRSVPPEVPIDGYTVTDLLKARMYNAPDEVAYKYFEIYYRYVYNKNQKQEDKVIPELDVEELKNIEEEAEEILKQKKK